VSCVSPRWGKTRYSIKPVRECSEGLESLPKSQKSQTIVKQEPTGVSEGPKGLYVYALVGNVEARCLLDLGAQTNLISPELVETISQQQELEINPSTETLVGFGGMKGQNHGLVSIPTELGDESYDIAYHISPCGEEVILGLPFLFQQGFNINLAEKELSCKGKKIPMFDETSKPVVSLVRIAKTIEIEPNGEYEVTGLVKIRGQVPSEVMITPSIRLVSKAPILLAKTVYKASPETSSVRVNLFHGGDTPVTLKKGSIIGRLERATVLENQESKEVRVNRIVVNNQSVPEHLVNMYEEGTKHLKGQHEVNFANLLNNHSSTFSKDSQDIGLTSITKHDIKLSDPTPIKIPARKMSKEKQEAADQQIDEALDKGIISKSESPFSAPLVMVKKKDGSYRMCLDYREVNARTVKDAYPLPRIQETLDYLSGNQWFCSLDLTAGYNQIAMGEGKEYTAFASRKGLFHWNVMSFGLCNAPATFQRLMDRVLSNLNWTSCLVYLDDILVIGKTVEETMERLEGVLDRLRDAGLKLKPGKCFLFQKELTYLGHVISGEGIQTDKTKIQNILDWPEPRNVKDLRSFLGLAKYYSRFVEGFSDLAGPLFDLTKKSAKFVWTGACQNAFDALKTKLTSTPILGYPSDQGEFVLDTDASDRAVGAVLSQYQDGEERVIGYYSKTLSAAECNYCVTRRELLAVVRATDHFRQYLLGRRFVVRSDHSSLQWLINFATPENQLARWLEKLSEFDYKIVHRKGNQHGNADALSRPPCTRPTCPCHLVPKIMSNKKTQCDVESVGVQAVRVESEWSDTFLGEAQRNDSNLNTILKLKEMLSERPSFDTIANQNPEMKALWGEWELLDVRNGLLKRKTYSKNAELETFPTVIPKSLRRDVMEMYHDHCSGHLGVEKTLGKIQGKFYWPKMKEDVSLWCKTCDACAKVRRPQKTPRSGMKSVRVGAPFERIAADIVGPFQETEGQNTCMLVVEDYFSKWVEAYAMPNQEAETIASKLVEEWIPRFGAPLELHTDKGANFEAKVMKEVCRVFKITKTSTTPYHPQSDGMVERTNSTLQEMLTKLAAEHFLEWDKLLPLVTMSYNSSVHLTTGFTPYMVLFGHEMTLPADVACGLTLEKENVEDVAEYVLQLRDKLNNAHDFVRENIETARKRAKYQYDKKMKHFGYSKGDAVWVLNEGKSKGRGKNKLKPRYEGPYFIMAVISDVVFAVQKSPQSRQRVLHHDKFKPYVSRDKIDNAWVFRAKTKPQAVPCDVSILFNDTQDETVVVATETPEPPTPAADRPQRRHRAPNLYGDWVT
jgi:transposase InsO family protein